MIPRSNHRPPVDAKRRAAAGLTKILVSRIAGQPTRGKLILGSEVIPCALGRSGITHRKREGDGGTPAGRFALVGLWWRADRAAVGRLALPRRRIGPVDGWCDDPHRALYNRPVRLPFSGSHEILRRSDALYDLVVTLDYNLERPLKGRGSAIFFHLAREDWEPTAGCIAIRREAMLRLLPRLSARTIMQIQG